MAQAVAPAEGAEAGKKGEVALGGSMTRQVGDEEADRARSVQERREEGRADGLGGWFGRTRRTRRTTRRRRRARRHRTSQTWGGLWRVSSAVWDMELSTWRSLTTTLLLQTWRSRCATSSKTSTSPVSPAPFAPLAACPAVRHRSRRRSADSPLRPPPPPCPIALAETKEIVASLRSSAGYAQASQRNALQSELAGLLGRRQVAA